MDLTETQEILQEMRRIHSEEATIGKSSKLTVGLVIVLIAASVWVVQTNFSLKERIIRLEATVQNLANTVSSQLDDRWRRTDMRSWVREFKAANRSHGEPDHQELVVPEIR